MGLASTQLDFCYIIFFSAVILFAIDFIINLRQKHTLRIDKGYPGGAAHFGNCSYNTGSSVYVLYIL